MGYMENIKVQRIENTCVLESLASEKSSDVPDLKQKLAAE